MAYLLLISFIIHAITLVVIRQLKAKVDQPSMTKQTLDQQQKEIEELLAVYLLEIREENDKLIQLINQQPKKEPVVKQPKSVDKSQEVPMPTKLETEAKYQDYQPFVPDDQEPVVEQSFAAQVLSLAERGDTPEAIAKKLNRGKTEVELLIKFHQNQ
ncbi:DUF6115 domain-containing protein [Amphibacillus indicireducens]|uniref:Swarming motility protein SwrB n=1 Tax=Amphibacillus indicireducens TaxID=1076330 RepID=A0ABP7V591_9BACI